ncbi:helix-turn-helix domain-containing protein [Pseudonocardia tropica]|uniref:Helix-turn-helix domain-containing protein n=1 Tax=Pseudonocardia tropica TaxID=681289 RepID=A0ABV1JYV7_9PSEU
MLDNTERDLEQMVESVVRQILDQINIYQRDGLVPVEDLRRSVRDNLVQMIAALRSPRTSHELGAPRETARRRAQQGAPLPEVIRAFRLCFAGLWDRLADEIRASPDPDTIDTVLTAATTIWRLTDDFAVALTEAHRETTADLLAAQHRRRSALAEALFTGETAPQSLPWEISTLLGFPSDSDLVVVSSECKVPGEEGLPGIETRLARRGIVSVWRLAPARQMGVIALGSVDTDDVLDELRQVARTRTGVSPRFRSLRETPRALHLAGVAAAAHPIDGALVTTFSGSPLAGLIAQHHGESLRLVREVLGAVMDQPTEERDLLLATARAWFDADGSAERAGAALFCHANTVRYRMRRIQELSGRGLAKPWEVAEFAAALQAAAMQRDRRDRPTPPERGEQ